MKTKFLSLRYMGMILMLMVSTLCGVELSAQKIDRASHNLRFVFLDHSPSLNSASVIERLRNLRDQALEQENALIIYMPSETEPFIVKFNIDEDGSTEKSQSDFGRLTHALNLPSHNMNIDIDRKKVLELMQHAFTNDSKLNYMAVRMEFYLTSTFWDLGFNESILAPIYFALDVPNMQQENDLYFDVYADLTDENMPKNPNFGISNLAGINERIELYDISELNY